MQCLQSIKVGDAEKHFSAFVGGLCRVRVTPMMSCMVGTAYLDPAASFSSHKESHTGVLMTKKSFQTRYSEAQEALLDLGTPRCYIERRS